MRKPLKVAAWCGIISIIVGLISTPFVILIKDPAALSTMGIILFAPSAVLSVLFMYGFVALGKKFNNKFLQVMAWIGLIFTILGVVFGLFANILVLTTNVTAQDDFGQACIDSDGGIDYYTAGYVETGTDKIFEDYCDVEVLHEFYCEDPENPASLTQEKYICPEGCFEGECITEENIYGLNETFSREKEESLGLAFLTFFVIFWVILIIPFSAYSILFGVALMKLDKKVEYSRITGIMNIISGATYIIFIGFIIKLVAWVFEVILMFKASEKFERKI